MRNIAHLNHEAGLHSSPRRFPIPLIETGSDYVSHFTFPSSPVLKHLPVQSAFAAVTDDEALDVPVGGTQRTV
jgi:hypothetical protein